MTATNKLFGFTIPVTIVKGVPSSLAESIKLDRENLKKTKDFFEKIITANEKDFLLTISANNSEELDSAIEYIHSEKEKASRIAVAPRLWWTKNSSSSYLANYVYDNSLAKTANISRVMSEYIDKDGDRKICDIGEIARKENCQLELENLITLLDVTRTAAVKANWAIKDSLGKITETIKLHEIAFRDSVNFDVIEESSHSKKINKISLSNVELLPSASSFENLYTNYLDFAKDEKTSINIYDKGLQTQVVRLLSRPEEKIFYTGLNGNAANSIIDSHDFATGFDVIATEKGVRVEPRAKSDDEGEKIGNAVALEMLKQVKTKLPEAYEALNHEAHKVYMVMGSINPQQAMSIGNLVTEKINTIFNEHDIARIKSSISYYERVAADFMQESKSNSTASMR